MRIGIDARIITNGEKGVNNKAEVAAYVYNLIKNLIVHDKENKYVLFFDSRVNKKDTEEFQAPNTEIVYFPFSTYRRYLSYAYSQFIVSGFLAKQKLDVFHAAAGTVPLTYSGPTVLTLFGISSSTLDRVAQKKIAQQAKVIITRDDELRKKIMDLYRVEEGRVISMHSCGAIENKNVSQVCIEKYLEIYTVAHNMEIKDNYLLKLPAKAISTVAKPIRKALDPLGRVVIYPIKRITKSKKKKQ